MLRVKSLIDDSRNWEGFITGNSVVRSMFETTNTHGTPDNRKAILPQSYLKLTVHYIAFKTITEQKRKLLRIEC
jgi:hypothetical protein